MRKHHFVGPVVRSLVAADARKPVAHFMDRLDLGVEGGVLFGIERDEPYRIVANHLGPLGKCQSIRFAAASRRAENPDSAATPAFASRGTRFAHAYGAA